MARLLYVRPETYGPYYLTSDGFDYIFCVTACFILFVFLCNVLMIVEEAIERRRIVMYNRTYFIDFHLLVYYIVRITLLEEQIMLARSAVF